MAEEAGPIAHLDDRTVPIEVETDEPGAFSALQQEALRQVLSLPPDVLAVSAPVVMQNYEVYREMIGDEEMPPLSDPVRVWDEVEITSLYIPSHEEYRLTVPTFMLRAECSWDPEHGLEVRFRDGVADACSQQGDLGFTE